MEYLTGFYVIAKEAVMKLTLPVNIERDATTDADLRMSRQNRKPKSSWH
jgi:hypothetical protein